MAHLYRIFADTVQRFGARVAVEVQRRDTLDRYTYSELHALVLDRARRLALLGIDRGERCAILADSDAHWCAAYFGTLALGAVVVPLDTNDVAAQVRTVLQDAGVRVLFTSGKLSSVATDAVASLDVVVLDVHAPLESSPAFGPEEWSVGEVASDAAAVVLYTSGATADPKGVVLTHANLAAGREAAFAIVRVGESDSVLACLPLFHSLGQLANLLLPFSVGARVVFVETTGLQELLPALSERRITVLAAGPRVFSAIHERIRREMEKRGPVTRAGFRARLAVNVRLRRRGINLGPQLFPRVHALLGPRMRLLIAGGSKFDATVGRDLYALGFTVLQAYGLTETSGAATLTAPDEAHLGSVGRPLPGIEMAILAGSGGEQYEDGTGEIAIRGPIVMRGYLNRPDATVAVMRDGWLLTGDLGRIDERGRLTITGRKKDVITLANGKNIDPEEIEAHYRQSPFVGDVCVMTAAAAGRAGGERLHGVIVPDFDRLRQRKVVNAGELLRFELDGLSAPLPPHTRLLGYELLLEPLPRTTTGTVKRHEVARRLAWRRGAASRTDSAASAADHEWRHEPHVARTLAILGRWVADTALITAATNLELDLGFDSLQRVELLTDMEQEFGLHLTEDQARRVLSVGDLIEAFRPPPGRRLTAGVVVGAREETSRPAGHSGDAAWRLLLRDLPPATDLVLGPLLRRRPVLAPLLYAGGGILSRLAADLRVTGLENVPLDGPFLLCPNHQSYLDPFFVCAALPYRIFERVFFVGAVEYFETPAMAWVSRQIQCVAIDPDANLVPAMKAGGFGLAHGKVLLLFPEGERSIDGSVKRFKKGAAILSSQAGVPIVPVAIKGAYELWPRTQPIALRRLLPGARTTVRVQFGNPFRVEPGEPYAEAALRLRTIVNAMWNGM